MSDMETFAGWCFRSKTDIKDIDEDLYDKLYDQTDGNLYFGKDFIALNQEIYTEDFINTIFRLFFLERKGRPIPKMFQWYNGGESPINDATWEDVINPFWNKPEY